MNYKHELANLIKIEGISCEEIEKSIAIPPNPEMGDFSLPCFKFAKALRKAPQAIADDFVNTLTLPAFVSEVQAVAGYLNFKIDKSFLAKDILESVLENGEKYGASGEGEGKTICIDYSAINIAKPFHIGHLGTTAIGAALYRIYSHLGYKCVGINHLGDWGTQFGKLIVAYKMWGDEKDLLERGINSMLELYVRFHSEAEQNPALNDEARAWFKKIEDKDPEATEIFLLFKEITLKQVQKVYDRLGVSFDSYNGESFYNDKMQPVIDELKEKGLLVESEGAKVVELEGLPPCLILKSDGATLYATRDIAAAFYRKNTYDFYKCLYVVAYQQNLHFKQWFKVVDMMGYPWAKDMIHVAYGMVSVEGTSLSTRKGNVLFLEDVLNKAVEKTKEIISEKNPDLADKDKIAEQIGVGAVVFSMLQNNRIKDIDFSYDRVLSFEGDTGPYVQYTHTRCCSVLEKCGEIKAKPDFKDLDNKDAAEVIKLLGRFPETVHNAAEQNEPYLITRLMLDIAQAYNKYYYNYRIIGEKEEITAARAALTKATKTVLKTGLSLIGVAAPEKM